MKNPLEGGAGLSTPGLLLGSLPSLGSREDKTGSNFSIDSLNQTSKAGAGAGAANKAASKHCVILQD